MKQRQRLNNLDYFKNNENAILVTTDVASRGLDIVNVENVIHFNLPSNTKTYIHRCGRAGRAGREGFSLAIVSPNEKRSYFQLCKDTDRFDEGLLLFPVQFTELIPELQKRLSLGIKIVSMEDKKNKGKSDAKWYEQKAKEMDIDIDSTFIDTDLLKKQDSNFQKSNQQIKQLKEELNEQIKKKDIVSSILNSKQFALGDFYSMQALKLKKSSTQKQNARKIFKNIK
jgi:ATP-dependent RNA helicase DDX24/MAK5